MGAVRAELFGVALGLFSLLFGLFGGCLGLFGAVLEEENALSDALCEVSQKRDSMITKEGASRSCSGPALVCWYLFGLVHSCSDIFGGCLVLLEAIQGYTCDVWGCLHGCPWLVGIVQGCLAVVWNVGGRS